MDQNSIKIITIDCRDHKFNSLINLSTDSSTTRFIMAPSWLPVTSERSPMVSEPNSFMSMSMNVRCHFTIRWY